MGPGLAKCAATASATASARRTALSQAMLSLAVDTVLLVRAAEELGERTIADELGSIVDRLSRHRKRLIEGT